MCASLLLNVLTSGLFVVAFPTVDIPMDLTRRQNLDFRLADSLSDPTATTSAYDAASAISAMLADIDTNPLPQKRKVNKRDATGYSQSILLGDAAINAPLNCNGADTYMGFKLWNDRYFDEARCAVACTAQSVYNLKNPPSTGSPKTCQFWNTYVLLKNDATQGQY
jgi:hypothetical protein